jgi:glycosyltransferase involved in cell wall biosynthesis
VRSLYLCYLPIDEPLVETQVAAYLRGLAAAGHTVHLLTFNTSRGTREATAARRAALAADGVRWHRLRYHKRPSLLATAFDVVQGLLATVWLCLRHRLDTVHARNHVPGAMALAACRILGLRLVFDIRGIMAEEYEDAGIWGHDSIGFKTTKWVERRCIDRADGIVVLTQRFHERLPPAARGRAQAIPSCADCEAIADQRGQRERMRERLGVQGRTVLVYAGKLGGWYMVREMVDFFVAARSTSPDLFFLILSQSDPGTVVAELERAGVPATDYKVLRAEPGDVGAHLVAADLAVSFIRLAPSKVACSPTKLGEYLAAGLPIVSNPGIGDMDEILTGGRVGVLVEDYTPASYAAAARAVAELLAEPDVASRCVATANATASLHRIGIPRYRALYASLDRPEAGAAAPAGRDAVSP